MGGNRRVRVKTKSGVRVPRGMTCESNPQRNKFRSSALASRNAALIGNQMLAVDDRPETNEEAAVNDISLDAMSLGKNFPSNKSMISEGGLSRLSQFTSCTNPAFDAVHREWKSGSSMQTEVVSVLAAVAELIKERDGNETDIEYFGALLTALEGTPLEDASRTAATAYLLSLIIKRISKEILQAQFAKLTQVLYTKLLEHNNNADGAVLKNLISALGVVLRSQPISIWQSSTARNIVVAIAALCTHDKPWVRTMSRRIVRAILTDPITATDNGLHAATPVVGQYIHQNLENALASKNGALTAVRYLCLLEGIMHKMPSNLFKQLAESILKSFSLADSMVKCSALQCLHRALQRQPCDAALSVETNVLLIAALRSLSPAAGEVAVCAYWMQALTEAHICLSAKDPAKGYEQLTPTLEHIVKLFETANEQLAQVTYQVLSRIIGGCIQDNEEHARHLLSLLDAALTLQSALIWKNILRTEMKLFEVTGDGIIGPEFTKAIKTLAELRQSDQCFCKQELDFTIGSAVRHVGAGPVLNILPLAIDANAAVLSTEFPRSWLIPILRVNLYNAPLSLFTSLFLPLAIKIYRRLPSLEPLLQRLYSTVQFQLWELLPSFCESPSDLEKTFPELAPVLGAALTERKDLRSTVLNAVRRLLKFALQPESSAERIEVVSRYAKNFMPLFFNLYTGMTVDGEYDDKGVRLAILETVRAYVPLTPGDLIERFVDSAITKSLEAGTGTASESKQARILDILCALSREAGSSSVNKIMNTINPWFISTSHTLQKKAYRILEELLCRRSDVELEDAFKSREDDIESAVFRPYELVFPSSRASLISCMRSLEENCTEIKDLASFIMKILDFVILSLDKSNSTHTRSSASKFFQRFCNRLIEVGSETQEHPSSVLSPVLSRIYEIATDGNLYTKKTADVALTAARSTLVALNIIAQKFIKVLNATHVSRIVGHGCTWISDGRAPVRILVIRLLRVLIQKMPEFGLSQYRELVLSSVFDGQPTADLTNKVRKANRLLLEVLVEKYSVEVLMKYTSKPEWVKQMRNIEKIRRKRGSKGNDDALEADSDDEQMSTVTKSTAKTAGADTILELLEDSDEENDDSEAEMEKKSRTGSVWLKEDDEGETTDLLDRANMINKLSTTDPALLARKKAKALEKKRDTGFKFTKEGKIVILDEEEEGRGRKRRGFDIFGEDGAPKPNKQKKEGSDVDSIISDDSDDDEVISKAGARSAISTASTYKAGGKGIHRDTKKDGQKKIKATSKGKKIQPYAYVPLRQKGAKEDIRKILKAKRKSGKGKSRL